MTFWLPGPWHRVGLRVMAHETIVAEVTGQIENVQAMADAQLISVAPELYDALDELTTALDASGIVSRLSDRALTAVVAARAVLLKAETL